MGEVGHGVSGAGAGIDRDRAVLAFLGEVAVVVID